MSADTRTPTTDAAPSLGPILAATDFSAPARQAVDRAAQLAEATGAPLTLLHVLPGGPLQELRAWLGPGHALEHQLLADAQRQLGDIAADLQASKDLAVRPAQAIGSALDEIHREAEAMDAALLVLGARGAGFLRRMMLGSTSERLLRRSLRPLLVVRQPAPGPYQRVLVALDFSRWSAQAIGLARRVAPQARLLLFNAFQVPFEDKLNFAGVDLATIQRYRDQARAEATRQVHALAAGSGLEPGSWQALIVEGEASQRLVEQEQALDIDLVVMGKHGRSATEDLLLGSVSKHVLAEGRCDVLVSTAHEV